MNKRLRYFTKDEIAKLHSEYGHGVEFRRAWRRLYVGRKKAAEPDWAQKRVAYQRDYHRKRPRVGHLRRFLDRVNALPSDWPEMLEDVVPEAPAIAFRLRYFGHCSLSKIAGDLGVDGSFKAWLLVATALRKLEGPRPWKPNRAASTVHRVAGRRQLKLAAQISIRGRRYAFVDDIRGLGLNISSRNLAVVAALRAGRTHGDVGREFNIGRERVRQIAESVRRKVVKANALAAAKAENEIAARWVVGTA